VGVVSPHNQSALREKDVNVAGQQRIQQKSLDNINANVFGTLPESC